MRISLRRKVALVFSIVTIGLLLMQSLGVRAIAERQEESLIDSLVADDMRDLLQSYRANPALVPRIDEELEARVSQDGGMPVHLPAALKGLSQGVHEVMADGREIHVAVATFGGRPVYRIYDFSQYESRFKRAVTAVMITTGVFALLTVWLAYGLSGVLVRQVTSLARQVGALRSGKARNVMPGRYDEIEVVALAEVFNEYHQRMAAMIAREKEFSGNVSHELRTPLTAIKTSCELLAMAAMSDKDRTRIAQIEFAADKMHGLIDALLALARAEASGGTSLVGLYDAVKDVAALFSQDATAAHTRIDIEIDTDVRLQINRPAFDIVLSNLLSNAVRHTRNGEIHIVYRAGTLGVQDTGTGIPAAALPHLFDRFYRATPASSEERHAGIGLAIVKKICDEQGWGVDITSLSGEGTQVMLVLPAAVA